MKSWKPILFLAVLTMAVWALALRQKWLHDIVYPTATTATV